ncbi:hypothetical protein F3J45_18960 [Pantoea sp. Ap-967]|uniref:hypothetical protein n=1 Tax=Pantoea sp. Ap-967 TaxID=2608362 RepID=UPI00141FD5DD|nr:hypothetical protein [Pantoea sp. Ap-967]NIE76521.1 hypothetical protein [Pantoea sp. Ap-967]
MSTQQLATPPDTTITPTSDSLRAALERQAQAELALHARRRQVSKAFLAVQTGYCLYLMLKWIWQGHYIGGPIYAVLVWGLLMFLYYPVSLLWYPRQRAFEQACRAADAERMEAGKAFLASQALGPYRWVSRGGRMLGVFPESRALYLLAPDVGDRHLLMDAARVVKQVSVDEQATTSSTSKTTTKHGWRNIYGPSNSFIAVIGGGKSRSTTTTTHKTVRTFTLQVQLQCEGQAPFWVQLPFADDWQEARNWQLLIEQVAGLRA